MGRSGKHDEGMLTLSRPEPRPRRPFVLAISVQRFEYLLDRGLRPMWWRVPGQEADPASPYRQVEFIRQDFFRNDETDPDMLREMLPLVVSSFRSGEDVRPFLLRGTWQQEWEKEQRDRLRKKKAATAR